MNNKEFSQKDQKFKENSKKAGVESIKGKQIS